MNKNGEKLKNKLNGKKTSELDENQRKGRKETEEKEDHK